jgi:regulator of protease activity HflC (stomatin/prohibitin superfamily)
MRVFAFLVFLVVMGTIAWVLYTTIRQVRGGQVRVQVPGLDLSRTGRLGAWLLGAIAVLYMLRASVVVVPGAHVACVYDPLLGGIQSYTLPEGLRFIFPWCKAEIFRTQTQEYTMSIAAKEGSVKGDDSIRCETNEGLKVLLDLTVLFHVDPQRAPELWRKLGADYNNVFVRPAARERIRMVVARYSIQEVYSSRRAKIEEELTEELRRPFAEEGLVLEQVLLRNVQYAHPEFAQAIGEKQARQQQVITEKRNLERAEFEKQATINQAKGEARSIALRAQTLAQNPEVVTYDMAQKLGPRAKRAYLSEGTVPLPRAGGGR